MSFSAYNEWLNEGIKHLTPKDPDELIQLLRKERIEMDKKLDELDAEIEQMKKNNEPQWHINVVLAQRAWFQREFDSKFIYDKFASKHTDEILSDE